MNRILRIPFRYFSGSKFYHPPDFKYDPEYQLSQASKSQYFVNLYRKYGHHYAQLDPLNLYDE